MTEHETIEALEEHKHYVRQKLEQTVADVIAVLKEDIPNFVTKTVKNTFLSTPAVSNSLSDEQVTALKGEITGLSTTIATSVADKLGDLALWLNVTSLPENIKTLEGNSGVWSVIQQVGAPIKTLLAKYGFESEEPIRYKSPAYFVAGKYMPSLSEAFWRWSNELHSAKEKITAMTADESKKILLDRWKQL